MKVLVTGGAGFIGASVIRQYIDNTDYTIINVDKLTYAGNLESLEGARDHSRHIFEKIDICDRQEIDRVFRDYEPDAVMHLAAESHVDRSIDGPAEFIQTNIVGTYTLLEAARSYWGRLDDESRETFKFHHVSTDEVYGDLSMDDPAFTENTAYAPSSPYSATKASSDHLVRAWHRTYGLPTLITNCSNNYGPHQFPEKLIPLTILNALDRKPLPVYGRGDNIRDWLFVDDHALALRQVLENGEIGCTYNIGGRSEKTNLSVVKRICAYLDKVTPHVDGSYEDLIEFVGDRPGHDLRYAIDDSYITRELQFEPKESFDSGLEKTVQWYIENPGWVDRVRSGAYREWIDVNYANRGSWR